MKRLFFVIFTLFIFHAVDAQATNWYVRPSGGSGSGSTWTAAWNGLNGINWSTVQCGDTIWVAGGTYTQDLNPAKTCTSGARLYIRRARSDASECTGAAGWSSSYDATVHQTAAGIGFNGSYNYITISGRTTAAGGANGWWIDLSGLTGGTGIEWGQGATASYDTIEYMDIQGPGYITYTSDGRGMDLTPFSSATGNTFSHLKIWNWESAVYNVGINNTTLEYLDISDIDAINLATYHSNAIYLDVAVGGTIRYNTFHRGTHADWGIEGILFEQAGGCSDFEIYGNKFYDNSGNSRAIEVTSSVNGLRIWNNTFYNVLTAFSFRSDQGGACPGNSFVRNNLIVSSSGWTTCGTASNNLNTTTNPFVNAGARDLHIVSTIGANYPRNAGYALTGYYSIDPDGTTYGSDGTWDIGAYEYNSGGTTGAPAKPSAPALQVK